MSATEASATKVTWCDALEPNFRRGRKLDPEYDEYITEHSTYNCTT